MRYRQRPNLVEAMQCRSDTSDAIAAWLGEDFAPSDDDYSEVWSELSADWLPVRSGQWIVQLQSGETRILDPEIFEEEFEVDL